MSALYASYIPDISTGCAVFISGKEWVKGGADEWHKGTVIKRGPKRVYVNFLDGSNCYFPVDVVEKYACEYFERIWSDDMERLFQSVCREVGEAAAGALRDAYRMIEQGDAATDDLIIEFGNIYTHQLGFATDLVFLWVIGTLDQLMKSS